MKVSLLSGLVFGFQVFVLVPALSPTAAAQDSAAGRALADQWCASCHAIAPGAGGSDQVPSFERIVQDRGRTEEWITTWLSVPHQSMPNLSLSRQEIADLVAYLETLRVSE